MSRIIDSALDGYVLGGTLGVGFSLYATYDRTYLLVPTILTAVPIGCTIGFIVGIVDGILDAAFEPNVPVHHIHHTYVTHDYGDYGHSY